MHVVTIANRKGGVGKTSVAVHIAAMLGRRGVDVVLIDLDSQANATTILTDPGEEPELSAAEVIAGQVRVVETLIPTNSAGVLLSPASKRLVAAQLMLVDKMGRERMLAKAFDGLVADVVIIDTGPDGHLAAANALVASTHVLIPFTADPLALHGLAAVEALVAEVKRHELNPKLQVVGAVQVALDRRTRVSEEIREQAGKHLGAGLFESFVRENSRFQTCGAWHRDVTQLEQGGERRGTEDYGAVTDELLQRMKVRNLGRAGVAR